MRLHEEINKIQEMMGVGNDKPSDELYQQSLNDIKVIIPNLSHKFIHSKGLEHNEETMIKINKEIMDLVKQGDDDILDLLWELSWGGVQKNAINIITAYHK